MPSQIKPLQVLPTFDFLYFFENKQIIILELKRTDLPIDAVKSDIYKWLLIDKDTTVITPLDFLSMKSGEHQQERFFRQGYLSFDSDHAVYIRESSSFQNMLRNNEIQQIPEQIAVSLHKELSAQKAAVNSAVDRP